MQKTYHELRHNLLADFAGDSELQRQLLAAFDLESMVEALADSAIAQISMAANVANESLTHEATLNAADDREAAIHWLFDLFGRSEVHSDRVHVIRPCRNELRIRYSDHTVPVRTGPWRVH